ncbi:MAG: isoprenylcysteine carboxylmethyltransferase family protein [Candidatus Saccharicenans sp.]|nr:isoprenylcysteine carboxylmethyltransferase family protein [Candidatus Saccharicenans sp.]
MSLIKNQRGMNIVGQGGKIILFALPSLITAVYLHRRFPFIAALPAGLSFIRPAGYVLLLSGLALWATALIQLLSGFSRGQLITTGAYRLVRNPLYSSATFFILPGVAFLTLTWVYFIVSAFLYTGVMIFIGQEERQLAAAFGQEYGEYSARVHRLIPLKRPTKIKVN